MERKYFSIEEAESILPLLRKNMRVLKRLQKKIDMILEVKEIMEKAIEITSDEGFDYIMLKEVQINKEFHKACYLFYKHLEKLNHLGCVVKDVNKGLIDFYSKFQGREVFLCWKMNEEKISHWHELNKGVKARKKIVDLQDKIRIKQTKSQ